MIKRSLSSIADQALLSALNFGVGVYLISFAAKEVYGLYVQLFAVGVLLCGVIDALIGNAIANLMSRSEANEMDATMADAQVLARLLGVALGIVSCIGAWVLQTQTGPHGHEGVTAISFGAYIVSLTFRDFKRASLNLRQRATEVLRLDATYAVMAVLGGYAMHVLGSATVAQVFAVLCMANALATVSTSSVIQGSFWASRDVLVGRFTQFWGLTRWALPGLATGWLGNSVYLYIVGFSLGLAATAELNASRLLLMPITLLTVAWQQMSRADIARLVKNGNRSDFNRFLRRAAVVIALPASIYLFVLFELFNEIVSVVSLQRYEHLTELLRFWIVYAFMYAVKFVGTCLLVGFGAYKPLLKMSMTSLLLQVILLYTLPGQFGVIAVIWCLWISEFFELTTVWFYLMPRRLRLMKAS